MQFIPARNTFAQIGESIAGNAANSYVNRADEMALQNAVTGLGKDASGEDIISAIINARTYSPQSKQMALQNYSSSIRKAEEERAKKEDRAKVKQLAPYLAETPEEQQALAESLSPKEAAEIYRERKKQRPESTLDKLTTKKNVENYYNYITENEKLNATIGSLNEVEKLAGDIGWGDRALNLIGLSGKGKQLEGISLPLIQPVLKIINPTGPVAVQKFKILEQRYKISGSDTPEVVRGKVASLRSLAKQAKDINDARLAIYAQYDGNPPPAALVGVEKAVDDLVIQEANSKKPWEKGGEKQAQAPAGKIRVKDKATGRVGFVTPYAGMEAKYDTIE